MNYRSVELDRIAQKVKPISPNEIQLKEFPDFVLIAFNELLQDFFNKQKIITITQEKAINKIIEVSGRTDYRSKVSRNTIFDNHWLDVEDTYREAGWKVYYDKPGYSEDYEPYFRFEKKI